MVLLQSVYGQGGRSFWIHNTGPLGCLPYVLVRFVTDPAQINKYGCADQINEVAQFFNQRLKEAVVQLKKDLPLAAITYVDVYSVKYTLITQAKKYGNASLRLYDWKQKFCDASMYCSHCGLVSYKIWPSS